MTRIADHTVCGIQVNPRTGCLHYGSALDIVAIKFKCCHRYYACYACHLALSDHPVERWQYDDLHTQAILCGCCHAEMTIYQYLLCENQCLHCQSQFNPRCKLHWNLYFAEACIQQVQ